MVIQNHKTFLQEFMEYEEQIVSRSLQNMLIDTYGAGITPIGSLPLDRVSKLGSRFVPEEEYRNFLVLVNTKKIYLSALKTFLQAASIELTTPRAADFLYLLPEILREQYNYVKFYVSDDTINNKDRIIANNQQSYSVIQKEALIRGLTA